MSGIDISPEAVGLANWLRGASRRCMDSTFADAADCIETLSAALEHSRAETAKATAWAIEQHAAADRYAAALTQSRAETAAAYERAAERFPDGRQAWPPVNIRKAIRALATTEQTAALDTIRAEAREQGMREAAEIASNRWAVRKEHAARLYEMDYAEAKIDAKTVGAKGDEAESIAEQILAAIKGAKA